MCRFLQWNIWNQEGAGNILSTLKEIGADILCLQELNVNDAEYNRGINIPEFLGRGLGFNYFFGAASEKEEQKFGNGIFSRFPIIDTKSVFIQNPPQPGAAEGDYSKEGRIYVEAVIQTEKGDITIGTTHMSYTDGFSSTPAKDRETDNLVEILKNKTEKFIFSGDLNALPDSYTVNEISKHLKNCGPSLDEKTWTTKPFSYRGFETNALDWRLDYCFATPDIDIKSVHVVNTDFSDHLPILIEF